MFLRQLITAFAVFVLFSIPVSGMANDVVIVLHQPAYTVGSNDTLSKVALLFGVKGGYKAILAFEANKNTPLVQRGNPNLIIPGEKFFIPGIYKAVDKDLSEISQNDFVAVPYGTITKNAEKISELEIALASGQKKIKEITPPAEKTAPNKAMATRMMPLDLVLLFSGIAFLFFLVLLWLWLLHAPRQASAERSAKPKPQAEPMCETSATSSLTDPVAGIRALMAAMERKRKTEAFVAVAMEMTGSELEEALDTPVITSTDRRYGNTLLKNILKPLYNQGLRPALLNTRLADMSARIDALRESPE